MKKSSRRLQGGNRSTTLADQLIGQRLRARRMELHVSQQQLGEKIGVSFQQVQKYEKGLNRIGSARLAQIADKLGTTITYFLDDLPSDSKKDLKPSPLHAFLATKDGFDINEAMMKLENHELRRSVIDFVRKLGSVYGDAVA
jgi:transcriptional regulator with XRE-family HTH domain